MTFFFSAPYLSISCTIPLKTSFTSSSPANPPPFPASLSLCKAFGTGPSGP